jgi:hypothetical protein
LIPPFRVKTDASHVARRMVARVEAGGHPSSEVT